MAHDKTINNTEIKRNIIISIIFTIATLGSILIQNISGKALDTILIVFFAYVAVTKFIKNIL